eukprot:25319-Eustigmatos_ZCMA.PRE.1
MTYNTVSNRVVAGEVHFHHGKRSFEKVHVVDDCRTADGLGLAHEECYPNANDTPMDKWTSVIHEWWLMM